MTDSEANEALAPFTPTTEQVRDMYEFGVREADRHQVPIDIPEAMAMFDRWLAEHNAALIAPLQARLAAVTAAVDGPHPEHSDLDSYTLGHISAVLDEGR